MTDVRVFSDADALAAAVAQALVARLSSIQSEGGTPAVVLTGGDIARRIHRAVAASDAGPVAAASGSGAVDWTAVDFWFGDERYVDASNEERNAGQTRADLFEQIAVDPSRVHEMPSADSGMSLEDAAAAYAETLQTDGPDAFDLVMLGLGPDGHVASLFPGHPALDVDDRLVVAVPGSPKPPPERISLTFPALNESRATWVLVAGEQKAEAVARALTYGTAVHDVPAVGIRPDVEPRETVWWLDAGAASRL